MVLVNHYALMVVAIVIPVLAALIETMGGVGIAERHHSHHDTYVVETSFSRALVIAMFFMGIVGIVLSWLCTMGVFIASPLVVMFAMWICMRRYRVATYEEYMDITPFVGGNIHVVYRDIERMEWFGPRSGTGYRNLRVYVDGRSVGMLWGILDLEQILMRVDRYDVLGRGSTS